MPRLNSRDPETDPAAFLGDELARAREAAGFKSQQALADHLGYERSVIGKAESGERPPSNDVLAKWCEACRLDYDHFARLATLARRAEGPIPRWFESWLAAEAQATMLRYWTPLIVPALFHTADYARGLFLASQTDISDEAIDALIAARLDRAMILDRADPPEVVAIIDESVLSRLIGSPESMREQLEHVAMLAARPNVCVQVVPADIGATAGLSGDIGLATVDGTADVLHTDAVPEGHTTEAGTPEERSRIRAAAVAFERVRQYALPGAQSRDLILKVADEWKQKT
jgi:transcriptional regulator with XRE-family HTH domain